MASKTARRVLERAASSVEALLAAPAAVRPQTSVNREPCRARPSGSARRASRLRDRAEEETVPRSPFRRRPLAVRAALCLAVLGAIACAPAAPSAERAAPPPPPRPAPYAAPPRRAGSRAGGAPRPPRAPAPRRAGCPGRGGAGPHRARRDHRPQAAPAVALDVLPALVHRDRTGLLQR